MKKLFCNRCFQTRGEGRKDKVVCVTTFEKEWSEKYDLYLADYRVSKNVKHCCPDCGEELIYFTERKEDEKTE